MGDALFLEGRAGHKFLSIYTEAPGARSGIVLVHGIGVHPDWGLIGRLRSSLADAGYTTLSVQMPVLGPTARPEEYRATFGEASERLRAGADFLRAKGYTKTAIVSHSMGSRMTYSFLTTDPPPSLGAWVCIGWASEGDDFDRVKLPVLDLYGEKDLPTVLEDGARRAASIIRSPRSQRIIVPGADHFFTNRQVELLRYVKDFLDKSL